MSKWLTIGQMIDSLKPGEIAESSSGDKAEWGKNTGGLIFFPAEEKFIKNEHSKRMNRIYLYEKWRILPNYVTFSEAMIALDDGKDVKAHFEDDQVFIEFNQYDKLKNIDKMRNFIRFKDLFEAKWTIES